MCMFLKNGLSSEKAKIAERCPFVRRYLDYSNSALNFL
jgi:hypothetical protein